MPLTLDQKRVIVEMMGLTIRNEMCKSIGLLDCIYDQNGEAVCWIDEFDPATNWDHAGLAMERLQIDVEWQEFSELVDGKEGVWSAAKFAPAIVRLGDDPRLAITACLAAMADAAIERRKGQGK